MNQEFRPKAQEATPLNEEGLAFPAGETDEYRPLLLRRDLIAMLPYLNRTEFCRRLGWEQAREVDGGFKQAPLNPAVK